MGSLIYGQSAIEIRFDDRALMHLQIVITSKLRRKESFLLTWINAPGDGGGRASVWLDPSISLISLIYRFTGGRLPSINRAWLDVLVSSASSSGGMMFTRARSATQLLNFFRSQIFVIGFAHSTATDRACWW